jgi:hypothetical protein
LNIELPLVSRRVDLSGTYTLTLVSAPDCLAGLEPLPEEARSRIYTAVLTQVGPEVSVVLGGASFLRVLGATANRMSGKVSPKGVMFDMTYDPWSEPLPVVETMATGPSCA